MKQWARWLLIGVSAAVAALSGTFAAVTANQVTRAGGSMVLSNQFWIAAGLSFVAAICGVVTTQALANATHVSGRDPDTGPRFVSAPEATVDRDEVSSAPVVAPNQELDTSDAQLPHRQRVERHPQTTAHAPSEPLGAFAWFPESLKWIIPTKWYLVYSLLLVAVCGFSSIVAVTFLDMAGRPPGLKPSDVQEPNLITWPAFLFALTVPWAVLFRRRYPVTICLATSAIPLILPYDALTPLVVLPAVFASRSLRTAIGCTAAASAAVAIAMTRDLAMHNEYQILASPDPVTGEVSTLPLGGYIAIGAVCVCASVGIGMLRRSAGLAVVSEPSALDAGTVPGSSSSDSAGNRHHQETAAQRPAGAFSWFPEPLARVVPTKLYLFSSLGLILICWCSSVVTISALDMSGRGPGLDLTEMRELQPSSIPAFLLAFIVPWLLLFRGRYPVAVCLVSAAIPLVVPYDALTPLVALTAVVSTRSVRAAAGCAVAAGVAVAVAMSRDIAMHDEYQILASPNPVTGDVDVLPIAGYVVVGILFLATSIGTGLWHRLRDASRDLNPTRGGASTLGSAGPGLGPHSPGSRPRPREPGPKLHGGDEAVQLPPIIPRAKNTDDPV